MHIYLPWPLFSWISAEETCYFSCPLVPKQTAKATQIWRHVGCQTAEIQAVPRPLRVLALARHLRKSKGSVSQFKVMVSSIQKGTENQKTSALVMLENLLGVFLICSTLFRSKSNMHEYAARLRGASTG